jgi:flagellar biosynthesis protein FliR
MISSYLVQPLIRSEVNWWWAYFSQHVWGCLLGLAMNFAGLAALYAVLYFGLALMLGMEGVADRIREGDASLRSQWTHSLLAGLCLAYAAIRAAREGR